MFKKIFNGIKRVVFRNKELINRYGENNNKVCMVVWNTFETDARVTKEAKSLIKGGKQVTVVAVHQPNRTKREEVKDGIHIVRVDRSIRKASDSVSNQSTAKQFRPTQANVKSNTNSKTPQRRSANPLKMLKKYLVFVPKTVVNVRFFTNAYRQKAGVYHSHDLNTLIPTFLVSRLRGAKLIYDAHEVSTDRAGWKNIWFWEKVESFIIKKADQVITTNETRANFFKERYNIKKPWIIRNVPPYEELLNSNRIRDEFNIPNDEPIILYQGGIQRERGIENMVKVIPRVKKGCFVFIGNGALKPTIMELAHELSVNDRTIFVGAVPNEILLTYTASADIGLQLLQDTCFNHYSACSNKIHEYIMAGIPVVSSDLPEMRRLIDTTDTGILVDPENLEMIADAINRLLNDHDLYQRLKENTKEAAKLHQWENEEVTLLELYRS
ncbi:glycosyltransferase family 4 protein [Alkalihalobacterium alkalinitrilicum]|uniref:glycosyltransferase family 4 protein n=1 Tax=Alkalihalobacterium alkalinitrilicum TaxID=427920 RepID=UPI0009952293|nr:glycosyltransferase family 4 protein [Alkalihalobacterium alkalinitrilicum]